MVRVCFFFNDTATTEIYTLSLHDALPISLVSRASTRKRSSRFAVTRWHWASPRALVPATAGPPTSVEVTARQDRKSTRLNSSHANISYAVFCLKKKKHHLHLSLAPTTHLT